MGVVTSTDELDLSTCDYIFSVDGDGNPYETVTQKAVSVAQVVEWIAEETVKVVKVAGGNGLELVWWGSSPAMKSGSPAVKRRAAIMPKLCAAVVVEAVRRVRGGK